MAEAARKSQELATSILTRAGLRPTRQRLLLAQVLFGRGDRHVTAEQLHSEAEAEGATISLATVYNTLHQFLAAGQVREVVIEAGRAYFDTNVTDHHHLYNEGTGQLRDISADLVNQKAIPEIPEGFEVDRIDVVIRLRPNAN
ncbi:MAG: Fur family transcriptional regulator [Alphaproteobacteria bacterium]|jgi:Fur family transcriptional regulator, iron response regulator|nr:Fur family transcriptional regulator [Alphaproteobacteria bacterium]